MRNVRVTSLRYDTSMEIRSASRRVSPSALARALACGLLVASIACSSGPPPEPIQLDRGMLTIDNRTDQAWSNVEIWINEYFRITTSSIPAGGRFQAPLSTAVSGVGQRFEFNHMQLKDVRLDAKLPRGGMSTVVDSSWRTSPVARSHCSMKPCAHTLTLAR